MAAARRSARRAQSPWSDSSSTWDGKPRLEHAGDTSPNANLAAFARDAGILVHDAAHTRPRQAAEVALQAGVQRLYLVHLPESRHAAALAEARHVLAATEVAADGLVVEV